MKVYTFVTRRKKTEVCVRPTRMYYAFKNQPAQRQWIYPRVMHLH
jgi:hypothetical protein